MKIRNHSEGQQWKQYEGVLSKLDVAHACLIRSEDYKNKLIFEIYDEDEELISSALFYTRSLPSPEELERVIREKATEPYGKNLEVIQHVYDYFRKHGEWPKSRAMRIKLNELGYGDLFQLEGEIGNAWIYVGRHAASKDDRTCLTFRAVCLCKNADDDITAFLKALSAVVQAYKEAGGEQFEITPEKLAQLSGITPDEAVRVSYFLIDKQLCQGHNRAPDGSIRSFTPADDILKFSKVRTKEDYLAACEPISPPPRSSKEYPQRFRETMSDYGTVYGLEEFLTGTSSQEYEYDIALSFAGEDRAFVEAVFQELQSKGVKTFYDKYEEADLWGKDLYTHLDDVYRNKARYCILFLSKHYAQKVWTNHERESAQARALDSKGEYILPARFDETEIPGIRPTTGYIDLRAKSPAQLVELVLRKLGR